MIENVKHRDSAQRGPFSVCPLTLSASAFRILNRASRSHGQHPGWIGETESRNEHSLQKSTPWSGVGGKLDWFRLFEANYKVRYEYPTFDGMWIQQKKSVRMYTPAAERD